MPGVLSDSTSSAHMARGGKGGTEKSSEHGGRANVLGVNCPDDTRRDHGEFAKASVHESLWSTCAIILASVCGAGVKLLHSVTAVAAKEHPRIASQLPLQSCAFPPGGAGDRVRMCDLRATREWARGCL